MAMRPPFVVRPLRIEDADAVRTLAGSLGKWFDAEGRRRIARDVSVRPGFVAEEGGRLVGFLLWTPHDREGADLSWMGVAEDRQHRGIGSALLAALVADLVSRKVRFLEVSTVADNVEYEPYAETRRFYRARRFSDFRVDPKYWGSGDVRYDRLVLRRSLPADP